MGRIALFSLSLLLSATVGAERQSAAIERVVRLSQTLHHVAAPHGDKWGWDTDVVPEPAQEHLTALKRSLRDLTITELDNASSESPTAESVSTRLHQLLAAKNVLVEETESDTWDVVGLTVSPVAHAADYVAVTTKIRIPCGRDDSFYLFRRREGRWVLVLSQESLGYDSIVDAQGWLEFRISPVDTQGNFFVVTANTSPWCSSCWQTLRLRVMRVGPSPEQPRILGGEEIYYYQCGGYDLSVDTDRVELELIENRESADFNRRRRVYRVDSSAVTLIEDAVVGKAAN